MLFSWKKETWLLFNIEIDIRCFFASCICLVERFLFIPEDAGKQTVWKTLHFQVIIFHAFIIVLAGNIDPVLRSFYLRLEILESLGGLQIRISFCYCHQPAE